MTTRGLRQADYLAHMLEATTLAQSYVESMRGMRNRLAYGYFDINLDVVWDIVRQALPALEAQLRQIQKSL